MALLSLCALLLATHLTNSEPRVYPTESPTQVRAEFINYIKQFHKNYVVDSPEFNRRMKIFEVSCIDECNAQ